MSGLAVWVDAYGGAASAEIVHALDMVAACRGAARALRRDGEEDGGAFFDAAAKGHTFRARELRYDARGGMTEELARRRFEPGAAWSVRGWWTGVVLERNGERVLFSEGYAEHIPYMTRENGWLFLGLGDANGGHVPPGGWP